MKQILQSFKTGITELTEVPVPQLTNGNLLIKTSYSLVSLGTERMLVEFGKSNLISKARQQPDKVKQVLDKIKAEGLLPTLEAVFSKLEQPLPLGYCNAGIVTEVGAGISDFKPGERVVSNGPHAEYVCVPSNLVARIPEGVSMEEASFTVIGAIGLQGIRLCNPTFGETIVVFGLGLIGMLTAQMLAANGCKVIGIDLDQRKCELAASWGIQSINPATGTDPVKAVMDLTQGTGADGVIITASAKNHDIISQSARMSRKRGRIILVGVIGLDISRAEFYERELTFQVSCSYGPGRYDENYEQKGQDYPLPYVRWTEKRNFEAILEAIRNGSLHVKELITEIVDLEDYQKIYGNIGKSKSIASLLKYPENINPQGKSNSTFQLLNPSTFSLKATKGVIGIIGAGNFTKMTMLPALKNSGAFFKTICSLDGVESTTLGKKYNFTAGTTDYKNILNDLDIDTVLITTRHNSHAKLVIDSLKAGKHTFVEKPLALNNDELNQIIETYLNPSTLQPFTPSTSHPLNISPLHPFTPSPSLTVGFNRRFSPHTRAIKKSLGNSSIPINIIATMNAGFIPLNVWVHDLQTGGGRIIGEACHYIDLCLFLTGSEITSVCMNAMGEHPQDNTDNASILLRFKNGSNAVINYFANGAKSYSKERLEVYSLERTWVMDNFRSTKGYGVKGFKNLKSRIDKGHKAQFHAYLKFIQTGGEPLIPFIELVNVTRAAFAAIRSLKERRWVDICEFESGRGG